MEAVKQWGISLCAAVLAGGIIHMMAPSSEMGKIMKITVSIFLLVSIFSPLMSLNGDFDFSFSEADSSTEEVYDSIQEQIDRQLINSTEKTLESMIRENLESYEIYNAEIDVTAAKDEEGQIFSEKIIIRVDDEYINNKYLIAERIKQQLGLDCQVFSRE